MSENVGLEGLTAAVRDLRPDVALVLGSGMGAIIDRMRPVAYVSYADVTGVSAPGVAGHRGRLTLAEWNGPPVIVLEGRLHFYEGHPWERIFLLVRFVASLGIRTILHTNAAGGIHDDLLPGSLMAVTDHIDCTRPCWWREPGPGGIGSGRPSPYSTRLRDAFRVTAGRQGLTLRQGIYAALTGPCYETPAEIKALRSWGADAVGMSTAREVLAGVEAGLECAAVSLITNRAAGLSTTPLNHEEVLTTAAAQSERLGALLEGVVDSLEITR